MLRALGRIGFELDRQKGSHMILFRAEPPATVTVRDHRERDRGTLRAIPRQAEITPDELVNML